MFCRNLFAVAAAIQPKSRNKLFAIHPFPFRNGFSTETHSRILFAEFASTKLNLPEAQISRMLKLAPFLKRLQNLHNVEQFIHTFKRYGFSEVQIANIIRKEPEIILRSEIVPRIEMLKDVGFEGQSLIKLLTYNPNILSLSIKNDILPKIEFLKNIFQSQDLLVKALSRAPQLLTSSLEKALKPSFAFWEQSGFSRTELYRFLQIYPGVLKCTSLTPAQVDLINMIGPDKGTQTFKFILHLVVISRTGTLEAKIQNLKLCGLSADETWQVFRAFPFIFSCSTENISAKMNFLRNVMQLPTSCVVEHPCFLTISLEKFMKPRFLVWQKMKSMNDLDLSPLKVLTMPEARFRKIIEGHPECKTLWSIYENAISNALNHTKLSARP